MNADRLAHICSGWCNHPDVPTVTVTLAYLDELRAAGVTLAPAEGLASASPLRLAALRSTPAAPRCETCGGEADENGCLRNNCRGKATPADPGDHLVLP